MSGGTAVEEFDIVIVGAGPAGSCLARLAARLPGLRIALVDARALDSTYAGTGRIKSCGGLMAPDAQKAMALMDMALPSRLLVTRSFSRCARWICPADWSGIISAFI